MESVKVSVVIPVYNVEKFVAKSLESIIGQSLKEIEIIVINDGSTDLSLSIIESFAARDKRIKIISTPNNGLSIARNTGLYFAIGEYIYFFDSDDILESNALEMCYEHSIINSLDFCFFDAKVFSDEGLDLSNFDYNRCSLYTNKTYKGTDILAIQLSSNGFRSSACLNFIKRSFLINNNLFYYPRIVHEDELFSFLLYIKSDRVGFINEKFFHRRIRGNSIMTNSFSHKNVKGILSVCRELYRYTLGYEVSKSDILLCRRRINTLLNILYENMIINLPDDDVAFYKNIISKEFSRILSLKLKIKLNNKYAFSLLHSVYSIMRKY